jgi:hypothetical protein
MKVIDPEPAPGQGARLTELWAWTAISPDHDTEGIIALQEPVAVPLVGGTRSIVEGFEPFAREVGRQTGATVQLRRFVEAPVDKT